ncbi:unnamed protein product [Rhizophagus irregularis]|nr:unnamed protein product [Rhizophagus irregularis]
MNKDSAQIWSLNEKSDIYSVGVLFWEISSGKPPFYDEKEQYECWNGEPDNRPTINQVAERLKAIITKTNIMTENQIVLNLRSTLTNEHKFNSTNNNTSSNTDDSLHGEMSEIIQNFDKINTKVIVSTSSTNENISFEKNLEIQHFAKIFLTILIIFSYLDIDNGIGTSVNKQKAVELFQQAANLRHSKAQYNLVLIYQNGDDVDKNFDKAFELFRQSANGEYSDGILMLGNCYYNGRVDKRKAIELYQQAANLGHSVAQNNLGNMYKNGEAEGKYPDGITMLAYCYHNGIGTRVNKQKAIELYRQAANLKNSIAQNNLVNM